ncbi:MAG: hypothetical protein QX197_06550, partial [Methylococcaceae bacterium]
CTDDLFTDYYPCGNGKTIIVNPNLNEETHLPGCAGVLTNPGACRGLKSMKDEVYAVRFKFKDVISAVKKDHFLIQTVTVDDMRLDDLRFRKFDMTVSTIPGDFDGKGQGWQAACSKKWATDGTELTIRAIQHNPGDVVGYDQCPLVPNTTYYINVKAATAGCFDQPASNNPDKSTYPAQGCIVSVNTKIPPSNPTK